MNKLLERMHQSKSNVLRTSHSMASIGKDQSYSPDRNNTVNRNVGTKLAKAYKSTHEEGRDLY